MSKFLKIFGAVALVLVVVIAGALFYFGSNADQIVKKLIEEQGSAAVGTPVRVGSVSIDLRAATGTVSGLTVANPQGFTGKPAIELNDLKLRLDAGSLLKEPIVVEDIEVGGTTLRIEQAGSRNNLQILLDNLRDGGSRDPDSGDVGPRVVVERFALTDASASVSAADLKEQRTVTVPDIVLTDIGRRSGGATGAELARQVLEPVIRRSLESAAVESVKKRVLDKLNDRTGGLVDRLEGGVKKDDGEKPEAQ